MVLHIAEEEEVKIHIRQICSPQSKFFFEDLAQESVCATIALALNVLVEEMCHYRALNENQQPCI